MELSIAVTLRGHSDGGNIIPKSIRMPCCARKMPPALSPEFLSFSWYKLYEQLSGSIWPNRTTVPNLCLWVIYLSVLSNLILSNSSVLHSFRHTYFALSWSWWLLHKMFNISDKFPHHNLIWLWGEVCVDAASLAVMGKCVDAASLAVIMICFQNGTR